MTRRSARAKSHGPLTARGASNDFANAVVLAVFSAARTDSSFSSFERSPSLSSEDAASEGVLYS